MVDSSPKAPVGGSSVPPTTTSSSSSSAPATSPTPSSIPQPAAPDVSQYKAPQRNPALRMMGIPQLPKKLPSRNWMIFLTLTTTFAGAIIYDRREKRRATKKWAHVVSHLANEPLPSSRHMPRRLTVYIASPPGDGFRTAREHYNEYVKPVLAASGLDWDFVQGRMQGDVRGATAERIRRHRRTIEGVVIDAVDEDQSVAATSPTSLTTDERLQEYRDQVGIPPYEGIKGDIIIGRHTWKEYVSGLHEGWLGPIQAPPKPPVEEAKAEGEEGEEEKKPRRPRAPPPYITPAEYSSASPPPYLPTEFGPSIALPFPHVLGFSSTFVRLYRYLTQRRLADAIGREVAAACLATSARPWAESVPLSDDGSEGAADTGSPTVTQQTTQTEQQAVLAHEEKDWVKTVWTRVAEAKKAQEAAAAPQADDKEKAAAATTAQLETVWASPMAVDPRISARMAKFELLPEDETRAARIVVKEEEIEGRIKGALRQLGRWGAASLGLTGPAKRSNTIASELD